VRARNRLRKGIYDMRDWKHKKPVFWVWMAAVVLFLFSSQLHADYDYITISDPFLNKIPMAVPVFKSLSDLPQERLIAREASDFMNASLEFTGYFKMIDRAAFLEDPQQKGIDALSLNFKNWTDINAELLVTGGVSVKDDTLRMEFRLFDTYKAELLFGKRYKGSTGDQEKMVLRFCSEIIYRLTGRRGVFDSRIAFVSTTTGNKEIFICDFNGENPRQISRTKTLALSPAWSLDGSSLAYTAYQSGRPVICIRNLSGEKEEVISHQGINITPRWVPGGALMAATLSFEGDEEIYLLKSSGRVEKRLTNSWGIDVSPSFSPDGKKMAFVSKRSGTPQVHIADLETGDIKRLTYDGPYNTEPAWSPAGNKLAYSGMKGGRIDIYLIDPIDGRVTQLTRDAGNNESPSWAPDGSLIAFSSTRTGKSRIFVMTASGTDQRPLLELAGEQSAPAWSLPALED